MMSQGGGEAIAKRSSLSARHSLGTRLPSLRRLSQTGEQFCPDGAIYIHAADLLPAPKAIH